MNIGSTLFKHSIDNRSNIRKYEAICKKLINSQCAVVFNEACISNNLLPTHSNIRLPNEAVQRKGFTLKFRRDLLKNETLKKKTIVKKLKRERTFQETKYNALDIETDLLEETDEALQASLDNHQRIARKRIQKKLCRLYGGWVPLPQPSDAFVNLSRHQLTPDQRDVLNLGLNYKYSPKFRSVTKKAELENLYQDICRLREQNRLHVNPDIQHELRAESIKNRGGLKAPSLAPRLRRAAQELRDNEDIIIRRADKSSVFVILNREDYFSKTDEILSDRTKFKRISKKPNRPG